MSKRFPYKSLVIVSIILGVFISMQIKTINFENKGMTTSKRGEQLVVELKALKKEEDELKLEIDEIKNSINQCKGIENENDQDIITKELEKYRTLAGYTDVSGAGIEIKIKNNEDVVVENINKNIIYNYDLILSLINKLNSAQVNAISINGERIVSNSYIHLKSDKLYINDTQIKEPFLIKAIGEPDTLASSLQIKYGIIWEIEKYYNAKVSIDKKENIEIRGNSEKIDLKYSTIKD
ncbi:MAG: DUF881 domain-containing protein [Romboutsia sp.]